MKRWLIAAACLTIAVLAAAPALAFDTTTKVYAVNHGEKDVILTLTSTSTPDFHAATTISPNHAGHVQHGDPAWFATQNQYSYRANLYYANTTEAFCSVTFIITNHWDMAPMIDQIDIFSTTGSCSAKAIIEESGLSSSGKVTITVQ